MKNIHSFMRFAEYLQTIANTFAQRDYQQLHQKLRLNYEHLLMDAFCRCYQKSDGTVEADVYLPVPHEDFSATPQSILLHEIGHMINLSLTGTMEVQPDDFEVVSALLHLNLNGVDTKEFFAHCFAMSLLIETELTTTDPFTMVPEMDKRLFQTYFRHILENRCVT